MKAPLVRAALLLTWLAAVSAQAGLKVNTIVEPGLEGLAPESVGLAASCARDPANGWLRDLDVARKRAVLKCFAETGWERLNAFDEDACEAFALCRARPDRIDEWTRAYLRHLGWLDTLRTWGQERVNPYDLADFRRLMHDPDLGKAPRDRLAKAFDAALDKQAAALVAKGYSNAEVRARAESLRAEAYAGEAAGDAQRLQLAAMGPSAGSALSAFFDRQAAGAPDVSAVAGSAGRAGRPDAYAGAPGPRTLRTSPVPSPTEGLHPDTDVEAQRTVFYLVDEGVEPTLKAFLLQRPPGLEVEVLVKSRQDASRLAKRIERDWEVPGAERVTVHTCNDGAGCPESLTAWSRDHYLLVGKGGDWHALKAKEDLEYVKGEASVVGKFLGAFLPERRSTLQFEGGHVVSSPDRVFLSADVIYRNPKCSAKEIAKAFSSDTGKPVTILPNVRNWPHIDLYVTPVGREMVVVGDSVAGAKLLRGWLDSPQAQGHPLHRDVTARTDFPDKMYRTTIGMDNLLRHSEIDGRKLDEIAAILAKEGLKVERVPMLTGRLGMNPIITYNNVFQSGETVFVGQYGIEPLDKAGLAVYEKLGKRAAPLPAYELARAAGAIHCAINVLPARKPASGSAD